MHGLHDRTRRTPRPQPTTQFEAEGAALGYRRIAGVDEAGRGPLAGPVVAAAVVLSTAKAQALTEDGLRDSKQLTPAQRDRLFDLIVRMADGVGVGTGDVEAIDRLNILGATRFAMQEAIARLTPPPDYLLLDAVRLPAVAIPQRPIIRGDTLSVSIAAASVIAKVTRDRLMVAHHEQYPQYNFPAHKGYATRGHVAALALHGPTPLHRKTFRWQHLVSHPPLPAPSPFHGEGWGEGEREQNEGPRA